MSTNLHYLKLFGIISIGCLVSYFTNMINYNYIYGKKIVKLSNNLDYYNEYIPLDNATTINVSTNLLWSIVPGIFNLLIWSIVIFFITNYFHSNIKENNENDIFLM